MSLKYAIGVDLGGTNLRAALADSRGHITKRLKVPVSDNPALVLKESIAALLEHEPAGVGISVAGLIDRKGKCIISAPNLYPLEGVCFDSLDLGLPVLLDNDASASARGEAMFGMGETYGTFVLMTLGTGIGGAYVRDGKVLDLPFEVGHISVEASGNKCPCGNIGCLENYASARAIIAEARLALEDGRQSMLRECCMGNIYRITPEDIYATAFEGDVLSRELLKNAGRYLGVGIATVINLLAPDAIVLTGGLAGAWDIYVAEALHEARRRTLKNLFERTEVVKSSLGADDAGVLGAAAMIFKEI
jgi:predicted NBD/HSP70 family sugar kinase